MSTAEAIADSVAESLNDIDIDFNINAENPDTPTLKPQIKADSDEVYVQVTPYNLTREKIGSNAIRVEVTVNILVAARITDRRTRRDLNGVVESLVDEAILLKPHKHQFVESESPSLYDSSLGKQAGMFGSLQRVTYFQEKLIC